VSGLVLAAIACGDGGDPFDVLDVDAAPAPGLPEAGAGRDEAGAPEATMRLAHLAAGVRAIDFCYRSVGTGSFEGPVLGGGGKQDGGPDDDDADDGGDAGDGAAGSGANGGGDEAPDAGADAADGGDAGDGGDGGAPGIPFEAVSRYLTLGASGALTIGVVARGASSCADTIVEGDVTLDPGKLSTVALVDDRTADAGHALRVVSFTDDRATVADKARVRVVHAALAPGAQPIAVRASAAQTVFLADLVQPGRAASASSDVPVDDLGYATIAPLPPPGTLAVGPAAEAGGPSWQSAPSAELGLVGGSLHTAFVLSGSLAAAAPYEILWCTDTSTSADRATCAVVR
jgi:hypothetical protein